MCKQLTPACLPGAGCLSTTFDSAWNGSPSDPELSPTRDPSPVQVKEFFNYPTDSGVFTGVTAACGKDMESQLSTLHDLMLCVTTQCLSTAMKQKANYETAQYYGLARMLVGDATLVRAAGPAACCALPALRWRCSCCLGHSGHNSTV